MRKRYSEDLVFVMCTAQAAAEASKAAVNARAQGYLCKPYTLNDLLAILSPLVKAQASRMSCSSNPSLSMSAKSPSVSVSDNHTSPASSQQQVTGMHKFKHVVTAKFLNARLVVIHAFTGLPVTSISLRNPRKATSCALCRVIMYVEQAYYPLRMVVAVVTSLSMLQIQTGVLAPVPPSLDVLHGLWAAQILRYSRKFSYTRALPRHH